MSDIEKVYAVMFENNLRYMNVLNIFFNLEQTNNNPPIAFPKNPALPKKSIKNDKKSNAYSSS